MLRSLRLLIAALLVALCCPAGAADARPDDPARPVDLHLFWSLHCPHCLEARPQILALAAAHPWIVLHDHELSASPASVERFVAMAGALGETAQAVPTLFYCGRMEVGWSADAAPRLLAELQRCRGDPAAAPAGPAPIQVPLFGAVDPAALSLPALTLLLAGLDAFNPCAFFVLLFLLSLLVHQRRRSRMALIGGLFVAVSGLMYFAFMAAWLNLFRLAGGLEWIGPAAGALAIAVGAINLKDTLRPGRGLTLSISAERRSDLFRRGRAILAAGSLPAMLAATAALAVAANFYELLCTAGLPMVYTRLLTLQVAGRGLQYLYLALYNLVYVLPLLLIVLVFVRRMGARRLDEREGRQLKRLSGLMMLGLGLLLAVAPESLADARVAFAVPAAALALTWLSGRLEGRGAPPRN